MLVYFYYADNKFSQESIALFQKEEGFQFAPQGRDAWRGQRIQKTDKTKYGINNNI